MARADRSDWRPITGGWRVVSVTTRRASNVLDEAELDPVTCVAIQPKISVRTPEAFRRRIKAAAALQGLSVQDAVILALEQWLARVTPKPAARDKSP
jgi:hypothetical protein